jgi:hypothetical protein
MKLTKEQLKQIIKEELAGLSEALPYDDPLVHRTAISSAADALSRLTGVLETDAAKRALSDKDRDILRKIRMWVEKLADAEQEVEGVEDTGDTGDTEEVEPLKLVTPVKVPYGHQRKHPAKPRPTRENQQTNKTKEFKQ